MGVLLGGHTLLRLGVKYGWENSVHHYLFFLGCA